MRGAGGTLRPGTKIGDDAPDRQTQHGEPPMRDQPGRPATLRQVFMIFWMMLAAATVAATTTDSSPAPAAQPALPQKAAADTVVQRIDELPQQLLGKDLEALGARMDAQDKRFDDQAVWLDNSIEFFGIVVTVLTVLLGAVSVATYFSARNKAESEARDAAKKWFENNAVELHAEIEKLKAEARSRIDAITVEMKEAVDVAIQELQEPLLRASTEPSVPIDLPPPSPALDDAARALQKKSPNQYSFEDWNMLAFAAYQVGDKEGAAKYWQSAAELGSAPESVAKVLMLRGITLGELDCAEDVVTCYDDLICRFGESTAEVLQGWVAKALVNRGAALGQLKRFDEEIMSYDEVIRRFGEVVTMALQNQVAMALVSKSAALGRLGRLDEAVTSSEEVIRRFGEATAPALQEQVAKALVNKVAALGQLRRFSEAIASYDQFIRRFGDSPDPKLRALVAQAREEKKNLQPEAEK